MHVLTIGFPFGLSHQRPAKHQIQANNASGSVSRNEQKYAFEFTAVSYRGASGSPVFDKYGNLVGVLNAGVSQSQGFNFAIRAEHLADLIDQVGLR
jgi:S1-C subfamily serine protease